MVRLVLISLALLGCQPGKIEVLFSCPSPDNKFVATFVRESGGGAAGYQYFYVRIKESGSKYDIEVFKMAHAYDLRLRWLSKSHLEIGYPSDANIDHWQNRFGKEVGNQTSLLSLWPGQSAPNDDETGCKDGAS